MPGKWFINSLAVLSEQPEMRLIMFAPSKIAEAIAKSAQLKTLNERTA